MTDLSDKHEVILDCYIGYTSDGKDLVYELNIEIPYVT